MSHPWGSKDSTRSPGTSGWEKWTRSKRRAADPQSPCKPFNCIRVQTDLHPQGPFSLEFETQVGSASFYSAQPPAPPMARPPLTCSCSISLYARSSSRALKRLCSRYMRVPSETGCTAKALRKAALPSFSGSLFLASSNERYCCP